VVVVERLHPSDVARGGELVRSPWADVPSGNPLALLEPRSRAVYLLLVAGESAAEVGARLVRDLRGRFVPDPELAAARTLASVSRALGLSPAARARAGRLRAIVPDPPPADDEPAVLYEDEIQAVWHFYMTTIVAALGRPVSYTLSAARRSLILTRLRDRIKDQETGETRLVTIEDLMAAISACAASDWHLGRSPDSDGTHYSLERDILRDKEQLERWLEGARGATRRRRAKARRGEPKLPPEPSEPEAREERL